MALVKVVRRSPPGLTAANSPGYSTLGATAVGKMALALIECKRQFIAKCGDLCGAMPSSEQVREAVQKLRDLMAQAGLVFR